MEQSDRQRCKETLDRQRNGQNGTCRYTGILKKRCTAETDRDIQRQTNRQTEAYRDRQTETD